MQGITYRTRSGPKCSRRGGRDTKRGGILAWLDESRLEKGIIADEIWKRDSEDKKCNWDKRHFEQRIAASRERDTDQNKYETELRKNKDRTIFADEVHENREQDNYRSDPGRTTDIGEQCPATHPKQPNGYDRYQEAMAILFLPDPALH